MRHFVYYPFGANMDADTKRSRGFFIGRYGYGAILVSQVAWTPGSIATPTTPQKVLDGITAPFEDVVLIVDSHGNGAQFCSGHGLEEQYRDYLEPEDLAKQLGADGLPDGFRWIKLSVCLSDRESEGGSCARKLAMALGPHYPQIMVAGVSRTVVVHSKASDEVHCMKCNATLPNKGFRMGESEDGTDRNWAGDNLIYYNAAGEAKPKSEVRARTHASKHTCPTCGDLKPIEVGEVRDSGTVLRSIVANGPVKRIADFAAVTKPLTLAATANTGRPTSPISKSTARKKRATNCPCGKRYTWTDLELCSCGKPLP
jgi:hypothetical protein